MTNKAQSYMPSFRAEKTTRNRDDLRVMISGVLVSILIILAQPKGSELVDKYITERPFVSAIVRLYYVEGRDKPMVYYDADAIEAVSGIWRATVHSFENDGARIATRRGKGTYSSKEDEGKLWRWDSWFESDIDVPEIPDEIFKVCVSYEVFTKDTKVFDETKDPFCSNWYDPANPTLLPEVFPQLGD